MIASTRTRKEKARPEIYVDWLDKMYLERNMARYDVHFNMPPTRYELPVGIEPDCRPQQHMNRYKDNRVSTVLVGGKERRTGAR